MQGTQGDIVPLKMSMPIIIPISPMPNLQPGGWTCYKPAQLTNLVQSVEAVLLAARGDEFSRRFALYHTRFPREIDAIALLADATHRKEIYCEVWNTEHVRDI